MKRINKLNQVSTKQIKNIFELTEMEVKVIDR